MKAAVLTARRTIEIQDIPAPVCGDKQVVVDVDYVGICGTEQHVFNGEFEERVSYPAVLGHEFGGRVVRKGKSVTRFNQGDRVVVDPIIPCRTCIACHEGRFNACGSLKLRGIDLPGGMAEEVVCDEFQLFPYPEALPMEQSPMVELYSIACHAAVRGSLLPGDTVAVFGAGKVGLSVIDVFAHSGACKVIAVDVVDERLGVAEKLGVALTVNPLRDDPIEKIFDFTEGKGVDKAVEAVGHFETTGEIPPPVAAAGEVLRPGGRLVVLGQGPQRTSLFFKPLVWKEIEIVMSRVSLGEFGRAVRLLEKGALHPDEIITHVVPLEKAGEMFVKLEQDKERYIKVVLRV